MIQKLTQGLAQGLTQRGEEPKEMGKESGISSKFVREDNSEKLSPIERDFLYLAENFDIVHLDILLNKNGQRPFCLDQYKSLLENSLIEKNFVEICFFINAMPAFAHYEKTKEILDPLLPFFDQDGRFYGLGIGGYQARGLEENQKNKTPDSIQKGSGDSKFTKVWGPIAREILPQMRLEKTLEEDTGVSSNDKRADKVLLSSYVSKSHGEVSLDYKEVRGSIHGFFSSKANLSPLTHCCGDIYFWQASEVLAPNLEWVGGNLSLRKAREINTPKLSKVGRHLIATNAEKINLSSLKRLGESLSTQCLEELKAPELEEIGRDLDGLCLKKCSLPKLRRIGKNFLANGLRTLDAKKLIEVGYELRIPKEIIENLSNYQLTKLLNSVKEPRSRQPLEIESSKRKAFSKAISEATSKTLTLE